MTEASGVFRSCARYMTRSFLRAVSSRRSVCASMSFDFASLSGTAISLGMPASGESLSINCPTALPMRRRSAFRRSRETTPITITQNAKTASASLNARPFMAIQSG